MNTIASLLGLVTATFVRRPYVFAFLGVSAVAGIRDLGRREAARFAAWTLAVAWTAEFASTRVGIPFGRYYYTEATRHQELYISNVPFFDSVSFVFLAYAAYCLARVTLGRARGFGVVVLGAALMMCLDVVIDPLAVRGERWFLGRIFYYPDGGALFGVPLSNYAGWLVVGALSIGGFMLGRPSVAMGRPTGGAGLYYGVLAFNLAMTWWIGEPTLFALGVGLHLSLGFVLWCWYAVGRARTDALAAYRGSGVRAE
jgi:putative membrane protein